MFFRAAASVRLEICNYIHVLIPIQAFRPVARPTFLRPVRSAFQFPSGPSIPSAIHARLLSNETRTAIDKAVSSAPVVLFMKGTPETPQCGFSRASIQILGLQGVDPKKFVAFNVLEDAELRSGRLDPHPSFAVLGDSLCLCCRCEGIL